MVSIFIYPEVIPEIRSACLKHIAGLASADDLQCAVQRGEMMIVAIEENDIRNFLTDVEGQFGID